MSGSILFKSNMMIAFVVLFAFSFFVSCHSENESDSLKVDGDDTSVDSEKEEAAKEDTCKNKDTDGATSACLKPSKKAEYYIEQSLKYFDTLDINADPKSVPNYSELVARWEWPPWLLLTAYTRDTMNATATFLRQFDPSTVPKRDCRAFDKQPFGRCYIVFEYEGRPCPIYEEFTFNDKGEMTFIEAWSDLPGMLPMDKEKDTWAKGGNINRLSTRVPGLGNSEGKIDLESNWMNEAAATDKDLKDFVKRAGDQWVFWMEELQKAGNDLYERGCGWK